MPELIKISTFQCDITPPIGHPLCAGWYPDVSAIGDSLSANGIIIQSENKTIVICTLDWAELSNYEHLRWRQALAEATGTTADQVAVHCTHCHDSPWPDQEAQELLNKYNNPDIILTGTWADDVRKETAEAAQAAMTDLKPCSHVSTGQEKVLDIASNRRVRENGKLKGVRWTYCPNEEIRHAPEGLIDPFLKTVSFWNDDEKLVSLHYYATHPTAYDGTGIVTPEFVGLARNKVSEEENVPHIYFTGCAGNITAGKYNDGNDESRVWFTNEIYRAMKTSETFADKQKLDTIDWHLENIHLPARVDANGSDARERMDYDALLDVLKSDADSRTKSRAALILTYKERCDTLPIPVTTLQLNKDIFILHLPGEAFMEYQHFAYGENPSAFTCVASYGDLGPGYICMKESFDEGGYEPSDAFCAAESETILKEAITKVMRNV